MARVPPAEGVLRHPGNDWLGRGPNIQRGHEKFHAGLDIFNHSKQVVSPENGRVLFAAKIPEGKSIYGGYGPFVVVVYGDSEVYHWLAHVKDPIVRRNDYVVAGQVVALSTTDHVHWECRQILKPYKGAKYWPWTVTYDPLRWLMRIELTAMDALDYVKSHTAGEDWKEPRKRMEILRRPLVPKDQLNVYPIRLKWTKEQKTRILNDTVVFHAVMERRKTRRAQEVAIGIFAGLAVLAAILA